MERSRWAEVMTQEILTRASRFAQALLPGQIEEAEDLYTEGVYRAWRYFDRFDNAHRRVGELVPVTTPAGTWLNCIIRHVFLDMLRKRRSHPQHNGALSLDAPGVAAVVEHYAFLPDVAEQFAEERRYDGVRQRVATLPAPYRAVIVTVDMEGASYEEAATRLGIVSGTLRSRLFRARALLKERCHSQTEEELTQL